MNDFIKRNIKLGREAEYTRLHDQIWLEMVELLKAAGIFNYTIFVSGNDLISYYECQHGINLLREHRMKVQWLAIGTST